MIWEFFSLLILLYFFGVSLISLFMFLISFIAITRHHLRARFATPGEILKAKITPPVSVLIPAYNEEKNIVESVLALQRLAYPEFEIIIINDGSTDKTLQVLQTSFELRKTRRVYHRILPAKEIRGVYRSKTIPNLLVIDKENGGKADALNVGVNVSAYPLVCSLDADSLLEPHALLRVVHPFMEAYGETIGTGGIVRAANDCRVENGEVLVATLSRRWLVSFQVVEYLRAFLSGRMGWSLMNALLIISGAFGLFKKESIIEAGGYRTDVVGEDMELVIRLHRRARAKRAPYRFHFVPDPVCWTEVPESWRVLSRQRNRWQRGLTESLALHISILFNPRYGWLGLAAMPYFVFVECLSPLIEVAGYVFFIAALAKGTVEWSTFGLFLSLAVLFGILLSLLAILIEEISLERYPRLADMSRLISSGLLENFGYRQVLSLVRVKAFWDYARGKKNWGDMERRGFTAAALIILLAVLPAAAQTPSELAAEAEKAGDFPTAAGLLEPWVVGHPDDLDSAARLAKFYGWSRRHAEAESLYRKILQKNPDNGDAETGLAFVLAWTGRYKDSLALFERVLTRVPGHADALTGTARAEIWRGRPNRARRYLRRLLAVAPNDEFARQELARPRDSAPKIETAYTSESYSRAGPGYTWRTEAVVPVRKSWSALAGVERVRRFQNTDDSGSFGAAWRGEGKGGYLRLSLSPDAAVLPRWALEGVWDHSLARGLYAEAMLRASEYAPAHTYGQSAALYWWPCVFSELGARLSATTTRFRGGPALARFGYFLTASLYPLGESLRLTPSFGRYEEPFEAGAGVIRSFTASVYHIGISFKPAEEWELKLDGDYEARSDGTFVRRGGCALAYQF